MQKLLKYIKHENKIIDPLKSNNVVGIGEVVGAAEVVEHTDDGEVYYVSQRRKKGKNFYLIKL